MSSFDIAFASPLIGASATLQSFLRRQGRISPHGQIGTRAPKGFPELDPTGAMSPPPTNGSSGARTCPRLRHGCRWQQLAETILSVHLPFNRDRASTQNRCPQAKATTLQWEGISRTTTAGTGLRYALERPAGQTLTVETANRPL